MAWNWDFDNPVLPSEALARTSLSAAAVDEAPALSGAGAIWAWLMSRPASTHPRELWPASRVFDDFLKAADRV